MSALESAFLPAGEARWRATQLTRGPWDPGHQHAGPPSALVARSVLAAAAPMGLAHLARLTVNLLRPIPIDELAIAVNSDYAGRNSAHFSFALEAQGKEVARGTALVQREAPLALPEGLSGHPLPNAPRPPGDSPVGQFPFASKDPGYSDLVESRVAEGQMFRGPCAIWFRLRHPIVAGEAPLPVERVAVAADSGNGISAILDFRKYLFVNTDLTINLLRQPKGEWVCIQAQTLLGPDSSGLAESRIYDEEGLIGRGTQSLVVRARGAA
jgi:hypothetical protein